MSVLGRPLDTGTGYGRPRPTYIRELTEVGAGTPMGELMRRYWIPAGFSDQIAKPDSPPVRVKLLGEHLVMFRDTQARVGLLGEHCPHRTASLFFGRNEECGLRCVYHGWKFDVDGNCVDLPSEPRDYNLQARVKAKAASTPTVTPMSVSFIPCPMPSASVMIAMTARPGFLKSMRTP